MQPAVSLRALLQDAGAVAGSVFADGGGSSAGANQSEQWGSTHYSVGPSSSTIGIACALIALLLVVATLTHWLHRSGRLPCCSKLLEDTAEDEPTFLQARHSPQAPPPAADPPPVVVLMPDDEVEIAVTEQHKGAAQQQRESDAAGAAGPSPAAPFSRPPAFWVVDADQQHSQASGSPRSEGFQPDRRLSDSHAVLLLHRPAPRAGMQRRQKAAPSDSFIYMI